MPAERLGPHMFLHDKAFFPGAAPPSPAHRR
jgi:hypothetical protein